MSLLNIAKVKTNTAEFANKVGVIAKEIGINPDYLMAAMTIESNLNPAAVNPITNATGLIQFMPSTANGLGTSTDKLKTMSNIDQLDYVRKYFLPYKNKLKTLGDVYLTIFYPAAVGKPDSYIFPDKVKEQNQVLDFINDGKLTKGDIEAYLKNRFPSLVTVAVAGGIGLVISAIVIALIFMYK